MEKTYFIFADPHGEYDALLNSLTEKGFDINNSNHTLISLGDTFDRGAQNLEILNFLMLMDSQDRLLAIRGNHDDMFLNYLLGKNDGLFDCLHNGMWMTVLNFSGMQDSLSLSSLSEARGRILERHPDLINFLKQMRPGYKIGKYILTHAGFAFNFLMNESQLDNWSTTPKFIIRNRGKYTNFCFVFGHYHAFRLHEEADQVKEDKDKIYVSDNFIGLDLCTNYTKKVGVLVIKTDEVPFILSKDETLEGLNMIESKQRSLYRKRLLALENENEMLYETIEHLNEKISIFEDEEEDLEG